MQVTETHSDGLKREFKVVVAAQDIDQKMQVRLQELGERVKIPGFRPGKVPVNILKKRFGPSVMGEVLERAVHDSSTQAMMERGLRPAMQPKIEITAFDQGKDLEYTLAVELMPEIEVADLSTIEIERIKIAVPDAEIDNALTQLANTRKTTVALDQPRKAETGDVLVIDFDGSVDGEKLPGMKAEDHHLELGSNQFVGTFEEQLIGAGKGDQRSVTVTFPEAYVNDKLAGKDAVFEVTVKDVLATQAPEINDELAKAMGESSLESLREAIRKQIEKEYAGLTRGRMKRELLDRLAESHDFPVPAGMVEAEFDVIWRQVEQDRKSGQADPEDAGKDDEALKQEYREIAERRVRLGLLLSEVGRVNSINVTQEEVNQALLREAQRHPGQEREVLDYFQKTPEALANLRAPIYEDKVIDYIAEIAKVSERSISPDELRQELEGEGAEAAAANAKQPKKAAKAKKGGGGKAAKAAAEGDEAD